MKCNKKIIIINLELERESEIGKDNSSKRSIF